MFKVSFTDKASWVPGPLPLGSWLTPLGSMEWVIRKADTCCTSIYLGTLELMDTKYAVHISIGYLLKSHSHGVIN